MENQPDNNLDSDKDIIPPVGATMGEKNQYFQWHPEDIRPDDLNNLHHWLPGGATLESYGKYADQKRSALKQGPGHSPAFLEQTPREYAKTLGDTIEELPDAEREAIKNAAPGKEEQFRSLVPLYIAMRNKGYTHLDVVS